MKQFVISPKEAGQRMDKYVFKVLDHAPRGFVYKMLRKKNIVLNEKKASGAEVLKADDTVKIYLSDETFARFASALAADRSDLAVPDQARMTADPACTFGQTGMEQSCLPEQKGSRIRETAVDQRNRFVNPLDQYKVEIVYEDKDILVMNKPAGMLSQKAKPDDISANECLIEYLLKSGQLTKAELRTFRPSICNRLDRNTSGLLAAGKTMHGLQDMAALFKTRAVKKFYCTIVIGVLEEPRHLTGYLTKNHRTNRVEIRPDGGEVSAVANTITNQREELSRCKGDYIETSYVPLARVGRGTLLEVHLITGRSHQIRAHLSSIGHPILGDPKYGDREINRRLLKETGIQRQLLHAGRMEFPDGKVIKADVPEDFRIAERWLKSEF